jgi:hypothetical protein
MSSVQLTDGSGGDGRGGGRRQFNNSYDGEKAGLAIKNPPKKPTQKNPKKPKNSLFWANISKKPKKTKKTQKTKKKKPKKNQKKTKKTKNPTGLGKKTHWAGFFKKKPGFFPTLRESLVLYKLFNTLRIL